MSGTLLERNHAESSVDLHFRVFLWLQRHPAATAYALAEELSCSHATAFRYTAAYRRVMGLPAPRFDRTKGKRTPISQPHPARASAVHPWSQRVHAKSEPIR